MSAAEPIDLSSPPAKKKAKHAPAARTDDGRRVLELFPQVSGPWVEARIAAGGSAALVINELILLDDDALAALGRADGKSQTYRTTVVKVIANEFPRVRLKCIRRVLRALSFDYTRSRVEIERLIAKADGSRGGGFVSAAQRSAARSDTLLAAPRMAIKMPTTIDAQLAADMAAFAAAPTASSSSSSSSSASAAASSSSSSSSASASSSSSAFASASASAAPEEALVECGCCYEDVTFESCVQCTNGHLFCSNCLRRYAQEKLFGGGRAGQLPCMNSASDACDGFYSHGMLAKALPQKTLERHAAASAKVNHPSFFSFLKFYD